MRPSFKPIADPDKLWGISASSGEQVEAEERRRAVDVVRLFMANKVPITLWGPVGARKTRTIEAMGRELDENGTPYQVITVQPSTEDPTVIHGIMYTSLDDDGKTVMHRSIPDIAQQVVRYREEHDGLTILFLDEMTTCMPAQQHALLGILTHGKYGDVDISDHIAIVMAANPEDTVSTVQELGEAFMNRGGHIAWFGDPALFLEEWRTGFGDPAREPTPDVDWYVSTLLDQAYEHAFRNRDKWDPRELVPYSMMEHTERAVTEHARMVGLVNEVFSECDDGVRHVYLIEVTRALLGNEWAARMATVTSMERDRISAASIVERVRQADIRWDWPLDDVRAKLGDSLYRHPVSGVELRQDQITSIAASMPKAILDKGPNGPPNMDALLAAWAFIETAPRDEVKGGLHAHVVRLANLALGLVRSERLDQGSALPAFVSDGTRETLRGVARRSDG